MGWVSQTSLPLPPSCSTIGLVDGSVLIRLKTRKNRPAGDTIQRYCCCSASKGVMAHIPAKYCPVHVLWPLIISRARPGDAVFPRNVAQCTFRWLRIALEARSIPNTPKYSLHGFRRGAAQALIENGAGLATLLRAGSWRSSASRRDKD